MHGRLTGCLSGRRALLMGVVVLVAALAAVAVAGHALARAAAATDFAQVSLAPSPEHPFPF